MDLGFATKRANGLVAQFSTGGDAIIGTAAVLALARDLTYPHVWLVDAQTSSMQMPSRCFESV